MTKYFMSKTIGSPVGPLLLVTDDKALIAVLWGDGDTSRVKTGTLHKADDHPVLCEAEDQLAEYFSGGRTEFSVPVSFNGTDFQQRVWQALLKIPYGETRTYLEIAKEIGDMKSVRAVGAANGKNPLAIIAPCHRVIGISGLLTGFAGGMAAKAYLLGLESRQGRLL